MTRREWLTGFAVAGFAKAQQTGYDRIDTHLHIHRPVPLFNAGMEKAGWRALCVCVSRAVDDQASLLPEMLPGTAKAAKESKGRFAWAAAFDPRGFENRDFGDRTVAELSRWFAEGAIAVKLWKNIGMWIRAKSGAYLLPDDKSLMPVYEAILKADRTVVAHLAEPNGAWMPLDDQNPEINYYRNNPQWHMLNHPGAPSKDEILNARDRVMARFPKLRLVGCHLGSNEDDLPALARRLDRYPNFAVDCAARVRYFAAGDRETVRRFLTRYQDRITYGTDYQIGNTEEGRAWNSIGARMEDEYRFFASSEPVTMRNRPVPGLGLPADVVKKIFHDNPKRWYPGIA